MGEFSVKPNDVGEKQLLIAKAQILAEKINSTDKRLAQVQSDADAQIQTDVGIVNGLLAEIAKTNEYIAKAELVKPFSAVDLRDQRQAKLEELAQYIDVTFTPDTLGQITVTSGTTELIKGKTVSGQTINATTGVITGPFNYNLATKKVQFDKDGAGAGTAPVDFSAKGKLQAQIDAAYINTAISREQIKDLAIQLKQEVNNTYNANGGTGDLFTFSTTSDGLLNFQFGSVSPTAGSAGGNKRALEVAELGTKIYEPVSKSEFVSQTAHGLNDGDSVSINIGGNPTIFQLEKLSDTAFMLKSNSVPPAYVDLTGAVSVTKVGAGNTPIAVSGRTLDFSGSFASNFNKTVTTLAQQLNTTNIRLEDQKLSQEMAVNSRDQFSGVSQDEEMTDMMKFQRSFQASARHVNVIDTLLEQVVNRLGVG